MCERLVSVSAFRWGDKPQLFASEFVRPAVRNKLTVHITILLFNVLSRRDKPFQRPLISGAIESLVDSPRGRWKGSCLVRLRKSRICAALLLEVGGAQRCCVKDAHPIVFA